MPIARRDMKAPVQVPAPLSSDGVLHGFSDRELRRAALSVYGDVRPEHVPLNDLARLMRHPDNTEPVDMIYRDRIKGRLSAIRAFCVFCIGGQPRRVKLCCRTECALWPFRMGSNSLRR